MQVPAGSGDVVTVARAPAWWVVPRMPSFRVPVSRIVVPFEKLTVPGGNP